VVLVCFDVYDCIILEVLVLLDDTVFVFVVVPLIVLDCFGVKVEVLETVVEAEIVVEAVGLLLEPMLRVEVEDAVPDLEFTDVEVPLGDIMAVRELADVLDPDGDPV